MNTAACLLRKIDLVFGQEKSMYWSQTYMFLQLLKELGIYKCKDISIALIHNLVECDPSVFESAIDKKFIDNKNSIGLKTLEDAAISFGRCPLYSR